MRRNENSVNEPVLAYPVTAQVCAAPIMSLRGSWKENLSTAAEAGYTNIECLLRDPDSFSVVQAERDLKQRHLRMAALGNSPMVAEEHLTLLDENPEIREETLRRVRKLIEIGAYFQVPVSIGKIRGKVTSQEGCTEKDLIRILEELTEYAEKKGAVLALEMQQPGNMNNINCVAEGLSVLRQIPSPSLRLHLDLFHMNAVEKDVCGAIREAGEAIAFVHLADTDRKAPGLGTMDYLSVMRTFDDIGSEGPFSMEIRQVPDGKTAAGQSFRSITELMARLAVKGDK